MNTNSQIAHASLTKQIKQTIMKYEITKEQLQELAKGNAKVERWFPEAFETKLEVGKWYKDKSNDLFFITEFKNNSCNGYGWIGDRFSNSGCIRNSYWTNNGENVPATESEVFEALKKEAVKRGFVDGVKATGLDGDFFTVNTIDFWNADKCDLEEEKKFFISGTTGNCGVIFRYGKWAEIIKEKTLSKSEAEAKLNELINDGYDYKIG